MPTSKFNDEAKKGGAAEGGEKKSQDDKMSRISKKSLKSKKEEVDYEESSPCSDDESRGENKAFKVMSGT